MITKDEFLAKYNITESLFKSADITWEELSDIYDDYLNKQYKKYDKIRKEFVEKFLDNIDKEKVKIHSFHSRIKDPEHLIAKIIRKKQSNYKKYKSLDKNNYEKFLTDLIGIRCLILFKTDWESCHEHILAEFENNKKYYINDSISDFDNDEKHTYLAENPKAHIRNGDLREIYENKLSPDSVIDNKVYRSIHYIIKYRGVYLEIQVRTLFEEAWGEVDHDIVYPYYEEDILFKEYTELLNRLSGLADEMSSFFQQLKKTKVKQHKDDLQQNINITNMIPEKKTKSKKQNKTMQEETCGGCIQEIFNE